MSADMPILNILPGTQVVSAARHTRSTLPPSTRGMYRERLLAIRHGELPWEALNERRLALHREFDAAYAASRLPERPDYARADAFLIAARRSMVDALSTTW